MTQNFISDFIYCTSQSSSMRKMPCSIVLPQRHINSDDIAIRSFCRSSSRVKWDLEEVEAVQPVVLLQTALPDEFAGAPIHDEALAGSEHDEVAQPREQLDGDQDGSGHESGDVKDVGKLELFAG